MRTRIVLFVLLIGVAGMPLAGQERLYPVPQKDTRTVFTTDRSGIVVERTLQHKLSLGYPKDEMSILPETKAPVIALWLRIQNTSRGPLKVDVTRFSHTDETGRVYTAIPPDEAIKQIVAEMSGGSIATRALRGISLGRAGEAPSEEVMKNHLALYSLQSGEIPSRAVKEGIIYFPRPQQKKFTINVTLGDLWTQPITFSTEKP